MPRCTSFYIKPHCAPVRHLTHTGKIGWAFIALIIIIAAQTLAYLYVWPLSLGPRVILQPWLMHQGYVLYKDIADEHAPLMYLVLSAVQPLASDNLEAAKLTLVVLINASTLLTFWAGKKSGHWPAGILSSLFFALWSPLFGYGKLWHETFLAPFYILILILWRVPNHSQTGCRFFYSLIGLLLGTALLIKQHALAVALGIILWLFFNNRPIRRSARHLLSEIAFLLLGISLPASILAAYYWLKLKALNDLVFWLITFNFINRYIHIASLWPSIEQIKLLVPAYLLVPPFVVSILGQGRKRDIHIVRSEIGLVLFVTSSLTVYPRFGFFHLQASLPVLAWLSGTTLARFIKTRDGEESTRLLKGMFCSLLLLWAIQASIPLFHALSSSQNRKIYEYSNLVSLAHQIRQHIGSEGCIYVLPDDEATANLYYLTQCLPPELWAPTSYPWFMIEAVKPKIVSALEKASPEWVVYFPSRWGIEQHGQELLNYVQAHYQLVGKLEWSEGEVLLLKRITSNK